MHTINRFLLITSCALLAPAALADADKGRGKAHSKAGQHVEQARSEHQKEAQHSRSEHARDEQEDDHHERDADRSHANNGDHRSDKAKAMQVRKTERAAIKEQYRSDVEAGGERVKGKKPWWKFWGE